MEITLKNKCCLYVTISIRFFSITICNLLIEVLSYLNTKDTLKSALADIQEKKEAEFKCHIEMEEEAQKNR
jgi:hypothetical protein